MKARRLGRTIHESGILIFASYALLKASQIEADAALKTALEAGINRIYISSVYGQA